MSFINGQKVNISITGARVFKHWRDDVGFEMLEVHYSGINFVLPLVLDHGGITVEVDKTPDQWPPLPGDVWHLFDDDGQTTWVATWHGTAVALGEVTDVGRPWEEPAFLLGCGTMVLAYRDHRETGGAKNPDGTRDIECACGTSFLNIALEDLAEIRSSHFGVVAS